VDKICTWPPEKPSRGDKTIRQRLRARNIDVSVVGSAFTRLDAEARVLSDRMRASVHYYNGEEEIDRFIRALSSVTQR